MWSKPSVVFYQIGLGCARGRARFIIYRKIILNIMDIGEKLDALDLIIHVLTEHEHLLDVLAERLDASIDRIEHLLMENNLVKVKEYNGKIVIITSRLKELEKQIVTIRKTLKLNTESA